MSFGVCLDVSGSMESAWSLDRSQTVNVERTHAIFTSLINIVSREVQHHNREETIFVSVFGVQNVGSIQTCDLVALLDHFFSDIDSRDWKGELIRLARANDAGHTEEWILKYVSKLRAKILYQILKDDRHLLRQMLEKIPYQTTMYAGRGVSVVQDVISYTPPVKFINWVFGTKSNHDSFKGRVYDSDAYKFTDEILDKKFRETIMTMETPIPRPVREVSQLLDRALQLPRESTSQDAHNTENTLLHKQVHELIEPIRPYILGGTPMCKALTQALRIFKQSRSHFSTEPRVLFILSDGASADGDPLPIVKELAEAEVTIVTCYLTSEKINNPKRLLDSLNTNDNGKKALFEMSSEMKNTHTPVSYLVDAGWELPPSGVSRLFVEANSLDVVNEFCRIVVSEMDKSCDAIVNLLEKAPLATYINQQNEDFKPKEQKGGTCYANAIAAVFHLAMMRIIGREGGYPDFYEIRKKLIQKYGEDGAYAETVIDEVCKDYRLQYQKLPNETEARKVINKRRPVVATFDLHDDQWDMFSDFYEKTPKEILKRTHVMPTNQKGYGGHAVVLVACDPDCLTFMNSWGQSWAKGGFFRVKDANVLNNMKFYDVYWTEADLTYNEKHAWQAKSAERAKYLMATFPSIGELEYECPFVQEKIESI